MYESRMDGYEKEPILNPEIEKYSLEFNTHCYI